ncbi:MAG TPA: putative toxin-antitoxin system toxin component, PIN family [Chloroflexia bacterium]
MLIDTNVLISYLLAPTPHSTIPLIIDAAFERKYILLMPKAILTELASTVGSRKHLAKRISMEQAQEFVDMLKIIVDLIPSVHEPIPPVTRDPKDDYLLAYALLGRADYLVTGDDDLLVLGAIEGVEIVRPAEFREVLIAGKEGL